MGEPLDFVAVGAGPFNLGLAALAAPTGLRGLVLEARNDVTWHSGMLLADSTLQVPFLADLVTLADPSSKFSFLQYLKDIGRLYPFYIRENFYPLRIEFSNYLNWAAAQLPVRVGHQVISARREPGGLYRVHARSGHGPVELLARHLVLGVGTRPYVPDAFRGLGGPIVHTADYQTRKPELQTCDSITIVGSGQSAAEIYRDLLGELPSRSCQLTWVTRSPRFFPMEYTKLTLELTSPEYTAYFQTLPLEVRDRLISGAHKQLYKGIDGDLINEIFDTLYRMSVTGPVPTQLLAGTALTGAQWSAQTARFTLRLQHEESATSQEMSTAALIFATGYRPQLPGLIEPLRELINWDPRGRYAVAADYTIDAARSIFVQNAEEHTHGFVAPDLGMGAYRNSLILNAMAGQEHYRVEERIAFQTFGLPGERLAEVAP